MEYTQLYVYGADRFDYRNWVDVDHAKSQLQYDSERDGCLHAQASRQGILVSVVSDYYWLTKPGIIYGNAISAIGGFLLASRGSVDILLFIATLIGISLVMASACVFNNYIDRDIDAKMKRTKNRALVSKKISPRSALIFASVLGVIGFGLLFFFANQLSAYVALFGHFAYVVLYGYAKRVTVHGTVVGSISGAVPPVVGYVAVADRLDITAVMLFLILVVWQMPHFYAIAMYRAKDYAAASIPVLPLKSGVRATKIQIITYIVLFMIATTLLTFLGITGYTYLVIMVLISLVWLLLALQGLKVKNDILWAKKLFKFSLIVLLSFNLLISVDVLLP